MSSPRRPPARLLPWTLLALLALPALARAQGDGGEGAEEGAAPGAEAAPVPATATPDRAGEGDGRWRVDRRLRLREPGGRVVVRPLAILMYDAGQYVADDRAVGQRALRSGGALRRAYLGASGEVLPDLRYSVIWDFSGLPEDPGNLLSAAVRYSGLKPVTLVGGAFKPHVTLEDTQSETHTLFLERAAVVTLVRSFGAGTGRVGGGVEAAGRRWFAAGYGTGESTTREGDSRERGAAFRVAGLPYRAGGVRLHAGVSGAWTLRPTFSDAGNEVVRLRERPELRVDSGRLVDTGELRAEGGRALGVEAGLSWRRLWASGEYYRFDVERAGGRPDATFSGWYAQGSYVLAGRPRSYRESRAAWGAPRPRRDFDPARGEWGAVEAGLRYSVLDLNDRDVRGGAQRIWTAGLNWYPTDRLRFALQYQNGAVDRDRGRDRDFQAVALRAQLAY